MVTVWGVGVAGKGGVTGEEGGGDLYMYGEGWRKKQGGKGGGGYDAE